MMKQTSIANVIIVMVMMMTNPSCSFQITSLSKPSTVKIPNLLSKNNIKINNNQKKSIPSSSILLSKGSPSFASSSTSLFMKENNEMSFQSSENNGNDPTSTSTPTSSSSSSATKSFNQESFEKALLEAKQLKERAEKERLEAEQMSIQLTQGKIDLLELKLNKLVGNNVVLDDDVVESDDGDSNGNGGEVVDLKIIKESEDLKAQIATLKKQIDILTGTTKNGTTNDEKKDTPTTTITSTTSSSTGSSDEELLLKEIPKIPNDIFLKRSEAFKRFPAEVKALYAKAVGANDETDTIDVIVEKLYIQEQLEKKKKERKNTLSYLEDIDDDEDDDEGSISLLDIANAQAGYSTLPPPIQEMIRESVGLSGERNTTAVIEKLIQKNKVKPTGDFGGVEFAMGDPDEDDEESRGKEREFTKEEIKSAIDLFDNLPIPMKTMLASSVDVSDASNSTAVIEKMIEEQKILPSKDGVEFVVFGNENDNLVEDSIEMIESDNYVKSMLPDCTRKEGNMPTEAEADAFFKEVLGRKTFNPISKPEPIPGGYIIRGENMMKSSNDLVVAMEKALEKSSVVGKVQPYFIRDPTLVTDEQLESNTFELPVVLITGPDIAPSTNRLVKPLTTLFGGIFVASFAVAACFANDAAQQDPVWLEEMASPLIASVLLTQLAHEAAHQVVAFKDKFKTGAPTLVPSFQVGLTGCITPIRTPPPSFNSLFDFAIAGPLVGMIVSLGLMYAGLEQQVFMDATTQAQLPCLPVEMIRSSSLGGGMIEWLLGDGLLTSPDPKALVRLHPLAIAGFVGILSNALSLLPIGNTDGGRVSMSLFGRSISRVVRTTTIGIIVFSSFFLLGNEMNVLLFYTIFAQIWQRESDIPCKNEIENVDDVRGIIALVTGLLVALSVIPMI